MGPSNPFPRLARSSSSITKKLFYPFPQCHLSKSATTLPLVHRQIYSPWSPSRAISEESALRHDLVHLPSIEKWGWVIYRCTYTDDATWAEFRNRVEAESRKSIAQSDAPEIAERLEWKWVEDASSLDGASTAALRQRFRAWVADEVARQPGDYNPSTVSRFRYFIKIDQEVLHSLAECTSSDRDWIMSKKAFVKFVDGDWESSDESQQAEEQEDGLWEKEILEPIDGCTEEDVGWMRISPYMINASFYETLSGYDYWYIYYRRAFADSERPLDILQW